MCDRHQNTIGKGHDPAFRAEKPGKFLGHLCHEDTLVYIFDDRDHAGAVVLEGNFATEDSEWLEIVSGDLVLTTDNPAGHDFHATVDGESFFFQDWSAG